MNNNKKKSRKLHTPFPMLDVGFVIKHPKHGIGVIEQIDTRMYPIYEFFYYVNFRRRGGDGSVVWLPKTKTENRCEVIDSGGPACENTGPWCQVPCPGIENCKA